MKLYGHFLSSPANIARYAANAIGVAYDYQHVDLMTGEQKTNAFLAINPTGKVPALQDETFFLSESGAIARYLARKVASPLYPLGGDNAATAIIDQWIDYSSQHVRLAVGKVLFNRFFAPMLDMPSDQKSIDEGLEHLADQMPVIDKVLTNSDYLAGNALSLGDIFMIGAMDPLDMIEFSLDAYPAIKTWRDAQQSQSWYQDVHTHYGAELNS